MQSIKDIMKHQQISTNNKKMTMKEMSQFRVDMYNKDKGNLHEVDVYNCNICKNKGYIAKVTDQNGYYYETLTHCKCSGIRQSIRRMKKSGLANTIKDCTFEKFETTEQWQNTIKEKAVAFTEDEQRQLFFIGGQSGCGKTHLCTAICRELIYKGNDVHYMLWREEAPKLKAIINDVSYPEQVNKLKTVKVLYIDDLFKTGKTENNKVMLPTVADINLAFEIINHRYNDPNLITIISSELMIQQIIDIDEATGGRIAEKSMPNYCISIKSDRAKNYRIRGITEL